MKHTMTIYNTEQAFSFILDMLSIPREWEHRTILNHIGINFSEKVDPKKLQLMLFKYLSSKERQEYFRGETKFW